jgi:hypothetical protein
MIKQIFSFIKSTNNVGVGTRDLGFRRTTTIPVDSFYLGPQWNPRRQLIPFGNPGYMKLNQEVVPVGIRGAGIGISGQYALQSLVDMGKG